MFFGLDPDQFIFVWSGTGRIPNLSK